MPTRGHHDDAYYASLDRAHARARARAPRTHALLADMDAKVEQLRIAQDESRALEVEVATIGIHALAMEGRELPLAVEWRVRQQYGLRQWFTFADEWRPEEAA